MKQLTQIEYQRNINLASAINSAQNSGNFGQVTCLEIVMFQVSCIALLACLPDSEVNKTDTDKQG